ncbi:hypothetical protein MJD09_19740, partial [bacterium]|nr:hypothetical protein [bacterium]
MGHKDRAAVLPEGTVNLAFSDKVPFQAFRIKSKPIYATQFHPEMTMQQNRERFETYIQGYSDGRLGLDPQTIRESFSASIETYSLLPRFIRMIVGTETEAGTSDSS